MSLIIRRLKTDTGTFNSFVNILRAVLKPKHRQTNSYMFSVQRNRTNFGESLCRGTWGSMHSSGLFWISNPFLQNQRQTVQAYNLVVFVGNEPI